MKTRYLIPLLLFLALALMLGYSLRLDPRTLPSTLIDQPVPHFRLARLDDPESSFSPQDMISRVWLLNVWASWCIACRQEHALLADLARKNIVPLIGLNYKEARGAGINVTDLTATEEKTIVLDRAEQWLELHGDPYLFTVLDIDGRVGIDFGVYGVPETFLIDGNGRIRYKHLGAITPQTLNDVLLPKIRALQAEMRGTP